MLSIKWKGISPRIYRTDGPLWKCVFLLRIPMGVLVIVYV